MPVKSQRRSRGRPRASGSDREETRRLILDAATALIAERGYHGTTVNEMIARAGLSKGTFYWHFRSKEEVLLAVLEERVDGPIYELSKTLANAPAERDMAPEASAQLLRVLERGRETILLEREYELLAIREPTLRARYRRRQAALRKALSAGLDARARQLGAPPFSTPAADVAAAYLTLGVGLAAEKLIDSEAVPDNLLGEMVALIYQGLVARAERRATGV